jgi:hypothetical protein
MQRFLVVNMGLSENTVKVYLKPGETNRMIGMLIAAEILSIEEHGWVVCNEYEASAMLLRL